MRDKSQDNVHSRQFLKTKQREEADSNRGPSAYLSQRLTARLGQTVSHGLLHCLIDLRARHLCYSTAVLGRQRSRAMLSAMVGVGVCVDTFAKHFGLSHVMLLQYESVMLHEHGFDIATPSGRKII